MLVLGIFYLKLFYILLESLSYKPFWTLTNWQNSVVAPIEGPPEEEAEPKEEEPPTREEPTEEKPPTPRPATPEAVPEPEPEPDSARKAPRMASLRAKMKDRLQKAKVMDRVLQWTCILWLIIGLIFFS